MVLGRAIGTGTTDSVITEGPAICLRVVVFNEMECTVVIIAIITPFSDCVSGESNAVGRVRLSARPFVSTVGLSSETVDRGYIWT